MLIGVIDSGFLGSDVNDGKDNNLYQQQGFYLENDQVEAKPTTGDMLGHGTVITESILTQVPDAQIAMAQVFHQRLVTTPLQIVAAIDWLISLNVSVINMSFGLPNDRQLLHEAVKRARDNNIIVVASSPARGNLVFPAAYPEVVSATGDARCQPDEFSWLNTKQAYFAACVRSSNPNVIGASVGCANVAGHIARYVKQASVIDLTQMTEWLKEHAKYWGLEDRVELRRKSTKPLNKTMIF